MFQPSVDWNPGQAKLRSLLAQPEAFDEAMTLLLSMHAQLHTSGATPAPKPSLMDEVWQGLNRRAFETMPTVRDVTVAWNIWHVTRIEDLTVNLLIVGRDQVLDARWLARLGTAVTDTGNAMSDEEILTLSCALSMEELRAYRDAVGERTREVLSGLRPGDLGRKPEKARLRRILDEGGVLDLPGSVWLLDFWGRKTVAGLLLMPVTRHQVGHLNDCLKLKKKCATPARRGKSAPSADDQPDR